MSQLSKVIEDIEALPDGELYTYDPPNAVDQQNGKDGFWPSDLSDANLKALVSAYQQNVKALANITIQYVLLKEAAESVQFMHDNCGCKEGEDRFKYLQHVIREAERDVS